MIRTKLTLAFTGLIFFSLLNWHCTKIDTTEIGSGLIPAVDNVNTFDTTLSVIANNFDSVGKDCATIYPTDNHVLGNISNDPLFGTTKATIYTELKPNSFPFNFVANPADRSLDSIVLILSYRKAFGDSLLQQSVVVNEVAPNNGINFIPDSSICTSYPVKPTILGSATYTPASLVRAPSSDSARAAGDTTTHELRIKLSSALGQLFLSQDSSSASIFYSDSLFKNTFKGFAITPGNTGNALSYFSLTDTKTSLAIYYKYKRSGLADTAVVANFDLSLGSASTNNIVRNHSGSEVTQNTNHPPAGDNFIYIQTTPGTYAEIKIPGLSNLSNRIIHRAELIMDQVAPLPADPFAPPVVLYLDLKDTSYRPIPCDFTIANGSPNITTFGGFKTTAKDAFGNDIARYTFNISRYVQKIVTNKRTNSILRLRAPDYVSTSVGYVDECNQGISPFLAPYNSLAFGRVKLVGGSTAVNRIRLHIIYSNL